MLITYFFLAYVTGVFMLSCDKTYQKCGANEVYAKCKIMCPPQFCNNSYTDYGVCPEKPPCKPGCNCKEDYLRDSDGVCVFNEDCPPPPGNDDECPESDDPEEE